ncbi:MAG: DnaB-like helicase N-terminal domain-containing protein, partial [Phycisphaerae bacterium]
MIPESPENYTTARPRPRDTEALPPAPHGDASIPPHDDAAEMAVIGSVVLSPDCFAAVAELLPVAIAFTGMLPRAIYSAMLG